MLNLCDLLYGCIIAYCVQRTASWNRYWSHFIPLTLYAVRCTFLQFCRYFLNNVIFEDVADFQIIEVFDSNAALISCLHFLRILFKSFQRIYFPLIDNDVVSDDPDAVAGAVYRSVDNITAGNSPDP